METTPVWRVLREDDNGNVFVVTEVATEADARAIAADFEARAHKQTYSVQRGDTAGDCPRR
jgi:UDP-N-acetyl-2-amino-2-deoxyglucuronate dehydrogenase